jgi:hypothetical protein
MTTVHPPSTAPPTEAVLVEVPTSEVLIVGDRLRRLEHRRKLIREQILAVLVLLVALAATVGVLALQWLGSGPTASGAAPATAAPAAPGSLIADSTSGGFALTHSAGVLQ